MTNRQIPPGRGSNALVVVVKPFGPHHCVRCFTSVQAAKKRWRGASNTRDVMIARGSVSVSMLCLAATPFPPGLPVLGLQFTQIIAQAIEPLVPDAPIAFEPVV